MKNTPDSDLSLYDRNKLILMAEKLFVLSLVKLRSYYTIEMHLYLCYAKGKLILAFTFIKSPNYPCIKANKSNLNFHPNKLLSKSWIFLSGEGIVRLKLGLDVDKGRSLILRASEALLHDVVDEITSVMRCLKLMVFIVAHQTYDLLLRKSLVWNLLA